MPVGCYGASAAIMSHISPEGNVYQAGTLSGNPIAMIASFAMCLRYSFNMVQDADRLEKAIANVLDSGLRTGDIMADGCRQGCGQEGLLPRRHTGRHMAVPRPRRLLFQRGGRGPVNCLEDHAGSLRWHDPDQVLWV